MGLPKRITYHDGRYPFIVLAPIGKKNKHIRSIGHKFERGLFSRLNDTIVELIDQQSWDVNKIRRYLELNGEAILPVSLQKEETVYPHLLRPELFLWSSLPEEHGLPLKDSFLYDIDFTQLSSEQLHQHVKEVLEDYMFLADVSRHTRKYWLKKIGGAFHRHPLLKLFHKKKDVIDAVEVMNQSALLSILKYPEDIAFWRHRVEIVMRPFRSLPAEWMENGKSNICLHGKELHFDSSQRTINCYCEACDFCLFYHIDEDRVSFEEEFDVERAAKRLITIEKQFNEIAIQNTRLLDQLVQLQVLKNRLSKARKPLEESLQVVQQIEKYQQKPLNLSAFPLLHMYRQLRKTKVPERCSNSELLWLSAVKLEHVKVFKELPDWLKLVPENVYPMTSHVLEELRSKLEEVRYGEEDVIITIKGRPLTYGTVQQILDLIHYYGTDYPVHTLVQMLAGKATNKLRTLHLHETRWFGLLSEWPEKHIQKLFNQLEKQGWLMKQQKGYSVSDFAEEVM
ncbi:RQC-minor-2 family DNA-binding protein [Halobacillus sp. BBL2006]|uniref:RQC-minor-2 family DNA-binding protein n=1 Tax=Halobacillus sp. BBL2006 TaxID=1543706 RepID=UPI000541EB6F|nr:RQC-minor-2 family DNA-binding protein [Halobacillus sp. BBL2006]KHE70795.1 hypothetical protein LD39_11100 [Halobacillus sp. BBL2006]